MLNKLLPLIIILGIVSILTGFVIALLKDNLDWEKFAREHGCEEVEITDGSVAFSTAIDGGGNVHVVNTYVPGQKGYLCNDGKKYWR